MPVLETEAETEASTAEAEVGTATAEVETAAGAKAETVHSHPAVRVPSADAGGAEGPEAWVGAVASARAGP